MYEDPVVGSGFDYPASYLRFTFEEGLIARMERSACPRRSARSWPAISDRTGHQMIHVTHGVAYSEIHNDEKGDTASGLLASVAKFYATVGIERIEAVMTDNHWSYTNSRAVAAVLADLWVVTTSRSGPTADGRTGK